MGLTSRQEAVPGGYVDGGVRENEELEVSKNSGAFHRNREARKRT